MHGLLRLDTGWWEAGGGGGRGGGGEDHETSEACLLEPFLVYAGSLTELPITTSHSLVAFKILRTILGVNGMGPMNHSIMMASNCIHDILFCFCLEHNCVVCVSIPTQRKTHGVMCTHIILSNMCHFFFFFFILYVLPVSLCSA